METLYHYCSTDAFHSIVQSRSVWLSSLSLANDTMEGKLVYSTLRRLAEQDNLDASVIEQLLAYVDGLEKLFDGLGFCLSSYGDLLSQWRGYASDATGVAIGFSKDYLELLSKQSFDLKDRNAFKLEKVFYDPSDHNAHVKPVYERLKKAIEDGAFRAKGAKSLMDIANYEFSEEPEIENEEYQKAHSELFVSALTMFPSLFKLKAHAFREEGEWRLLSHHTRSNEPRCLYRSIRDRIIPYYQCELLELGQNPIREVVLGPKHESPIHMIQQFLDENNFKNVHVYKSEASYR